MTIHSERLTTLAIVASAILLLAGTGAYSGAVAATHAAKPAAIITHGEQRYPAGSGECSTYQGERFYVNVIISQNHDGVDAFKSTAKKGSTPLCEFNSPILNQEFGGMVVDAAGKLWIMDTINTRLTTFPRGSNGTVSPSQTIAGGNTLMVGFPSPGLQHPAIDANGNCWLPQWWGYNGASGYITAYGNTEDGDVAPLATIGYGDKGQSEEIAAPVAVAFDSLGNLYVLEYLVNSKVAVFTPPFSDTEKPVAVWTIQDIGRTISIDAANNVYVSSQGYLHVFKHGLSSGGQYKTYSLVL